VSSIFSCLANLELIKVTTLPVSIIASTGKSLTDIVIIISEPAITELTFQFFNVLIEETVWFAWGLKFGTNGCKLLVGSVIVAGIRGLRW